MKIAVIGQGNVGTHLVKALSSHYETIPVKARNFEKLPCRCDAAIIAVKDDCISEVASRCAGDSDIICHTSGSVNIDTLKPFADKRGVFYPLQTFSKDAVIEYREIPFLVEGSDGDTLAVLQEIAGTISDNVSVADSTQRRFVHIAAVFACNFSNHLIGLGSDILEKNGLDRKILLPLLRQTVSKLDTMTPTEAQTGPAARKDVSIVNSHLELLGADTYMGQVYKLLSDGIMNNH